MLVELILPRDWYDDPDATFPSLDGLYGSEYSSAWLQENRGDNLKWETFLTEELPGLLARDWRTNNHRGAMGVSMGATASVLLAQRDPHLLTEGQRLRRRHARLDGGLGYGDVTSSGV